MKAILLLVCVFCLSGCGPSEQAKRQAENENVKKNVMGSGDNPMPKRSDYKNLP